MLRAIRFTAHRGRRHGIPFNCGGLSPVSDQGFLKTPFHDGNLCRQRRDDRDVRADRERHVIREMQLVNCSLIELLDLIALDSRAGLARRYVLDGEDVAGAAAHQLHAFAGKVSHLTVLDRQDGASGKNAQAQQVGEVTRVGLVTAVLQSIVFFDRCGVGQMDDKTSRLQTVDEPVPVVRGFDHDAGQIGLPWARNAIILARSFGSRFSATTRSVSSITLTTLLFECRSMPL